jgi:high-affinity Fe2+/Pb2+ permease
MDRRKLGSAALFLTVVGALLFMPPIATVFQVQQRLFGLPAEVIYLFVCWLLLIVGAWWLSHRLPRDAAESQEDES